MKYQFLETFYKPPPDLATQLLAGSEEDSMQGGASLPKPIVEIACEDIALRLWGYWANFARLQAATSNQSRRFCLDDEKTWGEIAPDLQRCLAVSSEYTNTVSDLLEDFFHWLQDEKEGRFVAPWGEMRLEGHSFWFENVGIRKFLTGEYEKATSRRNQEASKDSAEEKPRALA